MKFTEKSLTLPGQSYSPGELITRSKNGTMPAIYHDGLSYDFEDANPDGNPLTYDDQEAPDVEPLDSFPQLDDLLYMRDKLEATKAALSKLRKIHEHIDNEKVKKRTTVASDNIQTQITELQEALKAVAASPKNEVSGSRFEADNQKK